MKTKNPSNKCPINIQKIKKSLKIIAERYISMMNTYLSLLEDRARGERLPLMEGRYILDNDGLQVYRKNFNYSLNSMKKLFSPEEIDNIKERYGSLEKKVYEFMPNKSKVAKVTQDKVVAKSFIFPF